MGGAHKSVTDLALPIEGFRDQLLPIGGAQGICPLLGDGLSFNPAGQARQAPLEPHTEWVSAARLQLGHRTKTPHWPKRQKAEEKIQSLDHPKAPPPFFFGRKWKKVIARSNGPDLESSTCPLRVVFCLPILPLDFLNFPS